MINRLAAHEIPDSPGRNPFFQQRIAEPVGIATPVTQQPICFGQPIERGCKQAQLSSTKSELSAVEIDRAKGEHAIAVLVGEASATFSIAAADPQTRPPAIEPGLSSTLLERRPDLAAAERRVAAANARIGVAHAAFFPNVTLGGQGGFESNGGDWLSAASIF